MPKTPKVTIVSITYNHAAYIRDALDSFLMQSTNFPFEVLIADDCSTDNTADIIQEYANKYPDIIKPILRKKNIGGIQNLLDTLKHAGGQYIAICDGDDFWTDPQKLQLQVDFLDKNPSYALCFHPVRVFFQNNETEEVVWPSIKDKSKLTVKDLLKENFVPSTSVLYRRQNYDHIPEDVMPLDWYLHLYHAQFGKIGLIDKVMAAYRRHPGGVWWESHNSTDELWKKFGLPHASMYLEALKIYGSKAELRKIIHDGLSRVMSNLVGVDQQYHGQLISGIINKFPAAAEIFIVNQWHEQQQRDQETDKLNKEILDLRSVVFSLRGELHVLKSSLFIGNMIRFRRFLGRLRRGTIKLVHDAKAEARGLFRLLVPIELRRVLRGVYKYDLRRLLATAKVVTGRRWAKDQPLVSVVIPFYNRADTIDETIDSLLTQTFTNFEIIIVDDGSTDPASIQKLSDLEAGELNVKIIRQKNQRVAATRNNGIVHARGKYIICLDSDDMLEPTYIEKCTTILETNPKTSLVTTHMDAFGIMPEQFEQIPYNPVHLIDNNMVITAAEFKKEAWEAAGGYKSGIGYEDWEFWLTISEHGYWGWTVPELLFKYRTSMQSGYVGDKDAHWKNLQLIRDMHAKYGRKIRKLLAKRQYTKTVIDPRAAFINLDDPDHFRPETNGLPNILVTSPWMTFGGAETLIYNYCREIKGKFNITFVTGLKSDNEWEYKFREITPNIYHLANLFEDPRLHLEFLSNLIKTRSIDVLHIVHNGFIFALLPELKKRHPKLKVAVTLFNDRAAYFDQSIQVHGYIDAFSTDNNAVAGHFKRELPTVMHPQVTIIPNGINCYHEYSPELFERADERQALGIEPNDLAVFFVGRLSEEKNPDVFLEAAKHTLITNSTKNIKFFVIGDGPLFPDLKKKVAKIGSKNIVCLGYQAKVANFLAAADIFVLPSSIEGFPLSILEAMAMRVAVIASDVGAVADVIDSGKDGFVVTPGSESEITAAIAKLQADPKLLESVKRLGRQKVEQKYSNTILGDNYQKFYNRVIK